MAAGRSDRVSCGSLDPDAMHASATLDPTPLITLRGVGRTYAVAAGPFQALTDVSLSIRAGEFVVVVGQSGSGKSTLLSLVAGIDRPTAGEIIVGGVPVHWLSERELSRWRGRSIGIVFQFFQLLPTLTACENVMLPMDFCGTWPSRERRPRAMALLDRLGVADQADKLPSRLSGGQQQRVAVARGLINQPDILFADEPTGNLDSKTGAEIMDMLTDVNRRGQTIVMVTHDARLTQYTSRTIQMLDGHVVNDAQQNLTTDPDARWTRPQP
jgi:putative ABC transport system ATP-binding protein